MSIRHRSRSSRRPRGPKAIPWIEPLEARQVLSVNWISPTSGFWDVGANWSSGTVPTSSDDVVIDTASAETITIQSGDSIQVQSITTSSTDTLSITGGSLTASGSGVNLTAGAATTVSSASLYAKSGATLSLRQMTSYASDNNIFQA